eukprot:GHVL01028231.1.p1 GENE.GHVL01028231.1~~GHVL01028231.1.p1  ORF type:complete len:480 (+),score=146.18 GHVL01028231.1:1343-2782(+)
MLEKIMDEKSTAADSLEECSPNPLNSVEDVDQLSSDDDAQNQSEEDEEEEEDDEDAPEYAEAVEEQQKKWRKNIPWLYDLMLVNELEHPSFCVDWLPKMIDVSDKDYSICKLVLGSQTFETHPNYILVADIKIPNIKSEIDIKKFRKFNTSNTIRRCKKEATNNKGINNPLIPRIRIRHDGEVNRALHMPMYPTIIATKSNNKDILIYNYIRYPSNFNEISYPNLCLKGHNDGGFGLCWNNNILASGSFDGLVCIWDINDNIQQHINNNNQENNTINIDCRNNFCASLNNTGIDDVQWHPIDNNCLGTVGQDLRLCLWDIRCNKLSYNIQSKTKEYNTLTFATQLPELIITGDANGIINLWDRRYNKTFYHELKYHNDEIMRLQTMPDNSSVLVSCGGEKDRRVMLWDLSKIETKNNDDKPPKELMFIHIGHTSSVQDVQFHPLEPWLLASVTDDRHCHVWKYPESEYSENMQDCVQVD